MVATVKYQIATYSGEISVNCNGNDDNDHIIAKAKSRLRRECGSFPLGCQSFQVVAREA
jgi:hypothetical protein